MVYLGHALAWSKCKLHIDIEKYGDIDQMRMIYAGQLHHNTSITIHIHWTGLDDDLLHRWIPGYYVISNRIQNIHIINTS